MVSGAKLTATYRLKFTIFRSNTHLTNMRSLLRAQRRRLSAAVAADAPPGTAAAAAPIAAADAVLAGLAAAAGGGWRGPTAYAHGSETDPIRTAAGARRIKCLNRPDIATGTFMGAIELIFGLRRPEGTA